MKYQDRLNARGNTGGLAHPISTDALGRYLAAAGNQRHLSAFDGMNPVDPQQLAIANAIEQSQILDAFDESYDRNKMIRDAQAAMGFNTSTLAYIIPTIYQKRFGKVRYAEILPLNSSADKWAESIVYYSEEGKGAPAFVSGGAMDVPNVEVDVTQHRQSVRLATIGFNYSLEEQGQTGRSVVNMLERKAATALRSYDEFVDKKAMEGDSATGFEGLLNHSDVTPANVALNSGASSRLWSAKSPQEIITDLNACVGASFSATQENFPSNTILLPPSAYSEIVGTDKGADSDRSILEYFRVNNIGAVTNGDLQIIPVQALETAGAGGTRRMVAYTRTPEVLELHLPMPFEFLPQHQKSSMVIEVAGMFRMAGLELRHPRAVTYRDGF